MRIVVCCDGTSQSAFISKPTTNVARIARCILSPGSSDGSRQVVLYQTGIGTATESGLASNGLKAARGTGVEDRILEAYSFLCHNYQPPDDKIILIGFSRGAFVMRCVADMVSKIGLLTKKGLYRLPIVFRAWKTGKPDPLGETWASYTATTKDGSIVPWSIIRPLFGNRHPTPTAVPVPRMRDMLLDEGSLIPVVLITACALWDTGVKNAFQALSLHESRWNFPPIVLRSGPATIRGARLQQCWFAGYHSDIGGGREHDALGYIALPWMFGKLKSLELLVFDENAFRTPPFTSSPSFQVNKNTKKVTLQSSSTTAYRVMGERVRIPRSQFWKGRAIENVEPAQVQQGEDASNETIHPFVRLLLERDFIPRPPCLEHADIPNGPHQPWKVRRKPNGKVIEVKQAVINEFEMEILLNWLSEEIRIIQLEAEIGDIPKAEFGLDVLMNRVRYLPVELYER
ncbi:hypothetical protein GGR51DRAFT_525205 [Nemania sp. FL0031]|nr:hypothetical protein GGR51DRAFT_525205 [Nemania sp. FL0031]